MPQHVLILGATSDMALAVARKFASRGCSLTLAARNLEKLKILQSDIEIRHQVSVTIVHFDALDLKSHHVFYETLPVKPDVVICVVGVLGDQRRAETDWYACEEILVANYVGCVSVLNVVAADFAARRQGVIVGISSVAGERGRQSNYLYGSAKAGFTAYLSGLRNRLVPFNVHVVTVKPGFVKTRMIENMKTPGPLTASPAKVADDIYNAVATRKNVIYTLWMWRWVMLVIKSIPESMFKKMKL